MTNQDPTTAAALLGKMGGDARARSLSPSRRSEIAKLASAKRWAGHEKPLRATHGGDLGIGGHVLACAILEDGRRVVSERAFTRALGRGRPGGEVYRGRGGVETPIYLALRCLKPFIPQDFLAASIPYLPKGPEGNTGTLAFGVDATLLPKICKVWTDAWHAGALRPDQVATAKRADLLRDGFAEVGIIALVDEATGYQRERAADALAEILERFIGKNLAKWVKTFDDDYYRELCRLKGARYDELSTARPPWMANVTRNLIYDRLAPGVLAKLDAVNPRGENGARKARHHQWLTREAGYVELREHLGKVVMLMSVCPTWDVFKIVLDERLPKRDANLRLPLPLTIPTRLTPPAPPP